MAIEINIGNFLKGAYMEPLEISQIELAKALGVSTAQVSRILANKSDISTDMAMRLGKAFSKTPEYWLNLQNKANIQKLKSTDLSSIPVLYKSEMNE